MHIFARFSTVVLLVIFGNSAEAIDTAKLTPTKLRVEYLENPLGIDQSVPRLSWRVESEERGQKQTAYRILVASSAEILRADKGDLWDTGKVDSDKTLFVEYQGKTLKSRMQCFWKVIAWDITGEFCASEPASWSMGLLQDTDWTADFISVKDDSPVHTDVTTLHLPPARQYRKEFSTARRVKRAMIYSTALGIYELHLNGTRVGDAFFAPGWTDYRQRAYYNSFDVTKMILDGENAIGAWVADGWYSGYVGFGLLTGMGTEKNGRDTYGKTPSFMAQLEIEYVDGSREIVNTDSTWKVTSDGPIREADLLMGETYDAQREINHWSLAGLDDREWENAILATDNGRPIAMFYDNHNPVEAGKGPRIEGRKRDLGFKRPKLEAFPGVPVRITQEIKSQSITRREPGTFMFDLGQNIAGVVRLKIKGPKGHRVTLRYGEMLHPDGRLMTENLRKARATDTYVCSGNPDGEIYQPRFTFHGFQFVEVANYPGDASVETITGLVMHSDTPMTSSFECSDPMVNQLFRNVLWTQRANFLDLPTDCPQRDERMGWTGDAQAYIGTAAFNADIGAFYTKWLRELMESQRPSGAFPGYAPFPFQHGWDFGTAWADAGVICPWTMWQAYGDTRVIETCWEPMTRFMQWRKASSRDDLGISHGNPWGDWLAQGAETPLDYVDTIYFAISAKMMAEMAAAIGKSSEATAYREQFERTKLAFQKKYLRVDGSINVKTQTAQALALFADLIPVSEREATGKYLAKMLEENGNHMATGFLGTRPLLPVLSAAGQHDLAVFLLQSREFPSWGYEIENGATTIWERWDSFTKEDAFGRHNAAMNSFSHYAFGAVCEWMFNTMAGIQSDGPGYKKINIRPLLPAPNSNAMHKPIDWVKASYDSIQGTIRSEWRVVDGLVELNVTVPANTTATIYVPTGDGNSITESGISLVNHKHVKLDRMEANAAVLSVASGSYRFSATSGVRDAVAPLKTSVPKDMSTNPDEIDLTGASRVATWNFSNSADVSKWTGRHNVDITHRDGTTIVTAIGDDPQWIVSLDKAVSGNLAIELKATIKKGTTCQFFWAGADRNISGLRQSQRRLNPSNEVKSYLFTAGNETIQVLRFDPFATYDKYADAGEMAIESISIYALPAD